MITPTIISTKYHNTVSFVLGLPIGSVQEEIPGISKVLLSHLLRNNTDQDENQLAERYDALGIQTFSNVGRNSQYLGMNCPPQHVATALDLFEQLIFAPSFDNDIIKRIVQPQLGYINQVQQIPHARMILSSRYKAAFGDHPISRLPDGDQQSLDMITPHALENHYQQLFQFQPEFVLIGKSVSEEIIHNTAARLQEFGTAKPNIELGPPRVNPLSTHLDPLEGARKNCYIGLNMKIHGTKSSKSEDMIFSNLLQGGFSSRMFTEIRDKRNLSYMVLNIVDKFRNFGLNTSILDVKPERAEEALKVLIDLIYELLHHPISEDEIRRAQKTAQKAALFVADSSQSYAIWVINRILSGSTWDMDQVRDEIIKASQTDWQEKMRKFWQPENISLAVTGANPDQPLSLTDQFKEVMA